MPAWPLRPGTEPWWISAICPPSRPSTACARSAPHGCPANHARGCLWRRWRLRRRKLMTNSTLTPWMQTLARQIDTDYELVGAAWRQTHHHAVDAGKLLLEAMGQVPPLTGPDWITQHTSLSLVEAYALMRLAR